MSTIFDSRDCAFPFCPLEAEVGDEFCRRHGQREHAPHGTYCGYVFFECRCVLCENAFTMRGAVAEPRPKREWVSREPREPREDRVTRILEATRSRELRALEELTRRGL